MIQSILLALCVCVGPPPAERPGEVLARLRKEAFAKGKVVVLDFWATTCAPCRRMVPETNALIEELKAKPFVQVGVSTDPGTQTVAAFLKKTKMPWAHWWVGYEGKALETWDVEAYPTVYVIDHDGIIRHHQVGYDGAKDKLYDVVRALVKRAEKARAAK